MPVNILVHWSFYECLKGIVFPWLRGLVLVTTLVVLPSVVVCEMFGHRIYPLKKLL